MSRSNNFFKKVVDLCKTVGFVFESCVNIDGYSLLRYDYGPLGVQTKRNIQNEWWHEIVTSRDNVYVLEPSTFDKVLQKRNNFENYRSAEGFFAVTRDQLQKKLHSLIEKSSSSRKSHFPSVSGANSELDDFLFDGGFFLRQDCNYTNLEYFNNLASSMNIPRDQVHFGIAQCGKFLKNCGKSNFSFRHPEEEQLSLQFLCHESKSYQWLNYWRRHRLIWWKKFANTPSDFSHGEQTPSDSFGGTFKTEILYEFPWGKESVETILHNTDLTQMAASVIDSDCHLGKKDVSHLHLMQLTANLDRGFLALLLDAYQEKEESTPTRHTRVQKVMALHPSIAPIKVAIILCNTERTEVLDVAQQLASELRSAGITTRFEKCVDQDKRFFSHDEAGTPYCVTIRDSTLVDGFVALRNRDTTVEEYLHISELLRTVKTRVGLMYRSL